MPTTISLLSLRVVAQRGIHQQLGPLLALDDSLDLASLEGSHDMWISNMKLYIRWRPLRMQTPLDLREEPVDASYTLFEVS